MTEEKPTPTEQPDPAEPAGDQDPATEREYVEAAEEAAEGAAGSEQARPEDEDPLARAEREREEYLDLARRTQAELENYRKRVQRDQAVSSQRAKAGIARDLLPVVDNLERALGSAGEEEQHLAEGVRLVHSELIGVLERAGVQGFDPKGDAFDPERHEAISTRPGEEAGQGIVLDVVEKGYTLNGTVLRPARVVVSG
ncbi:MAG TPA: nucleotide exchange factor GrpE [Thermoleophilaceae bacterium]|nr:nucleotide exchange factor GrpE [Thermoleophilaceae bacterium]